MLVEHNYEIVFEREQVPQPIMCEMSRACRDIMYNIDYLSVSKYEALMRIGVVGDVDSVNAAESFLKKTGAQVRLLSAQAYKGAIPNVPVRTQLVPSKGPATDRKLWLTIVGSMRRQPIFWTLSRRFEVDFRILQSTVGDPVSILCLTLHGPAAEVEGAVAYLREQGVDVEFGEIRPGE